jgi:vitamin K-dependent gamma-carboxylase
MIAERIRHAALRPVDIASLAAFRIIFGAVMFVGLIRFLFTGWIEKMYGEPHFFFTYPGFDWVTPFPVWAMYVHYSVLALLALAISLGAFHRIACALFVLGFTYTQLIDITNYLNHHYLVVLVGVLLALLPANAAWSIDARRRPSLRRDTVPAWMVWLLRFQIGVVYVFAGLAKAKSDWLVHAQPLDLWLSARTETPIIGRLFAYHAVALAMSWAGFLFDTTIVLWLSWRRTRLVAYVALIVFHGLTGYLFNIGMFPLIMTSAALIFFSPSWPRHLFSRLGPAPGATPIVSPAPSRAIKVAIAAYVVMQFALPLRHLVYPGPVLWNEDGMRFAWHVMIREKQGSVMFVARFANGRELEVPPNNYLTWRQEREMSSQPDMIVQLAHHIGDDLHARGYRDFTLHARSAVSLNGRAPAPLIDPAVDLLSINDVGPRRWVLPAPSGTPPHVGR